MCLYVYIKITYNKNIHAFLKCLSLAKLIIRVLCNNLLACVKLHNSQLEIKIENFSYLGQVTRFK